MNLRACLIAIVTAAACAASPSGSQLTDPTPAASPPELTRRTSLHMGTIFSIAVASPQPDEAVLAIEGALAEVTRVEAVISSWIDDSSTSRLNRSAGGDWVGVAPELVELLALSLAASAATDGAFDITYSSCTDTPDGVDPEVWLAECLPTVSYTAVDVDVVASRARLATGVRIGFGAVGKGYGVDRAADALLASGLSDFVVDGGGDVYCHGTNGGHPWRVGVQHPRAEPGYLLGAIHVPETGAAIATSGDYESYVDGAEGREHHILDPRTGRVARGGVVSVTVIAPSAATADAFATGIFVLGVDAGLAAAEVAEGVDAIIVDDSLQVSMTSGATSIFEPVHN